MFSASMVWAQMFPFVALQLYDEKESVKDLVTIFLSCCFGFWLLLNVAFFCTINFSFIRTFFTRQTAPEYTCQYYLNAKEDYKRFDAVFENRIDYTTEIRSEVSEWVTANAQRWQDENTEFFVIEKVPDLFLPQATLDAAGGRRRRGRSSVSVRELIGGEQGSSPRRSSVSARELIGGEQRSSTVHPEQT